jgi:hypothetical protein
MSLKHKTGWHWQYDRGIHRLPISFSFQWKTSWHFSNKTSKNRDNANAFEIHEALYWQTRKIAPNSEPGVNTALFGHKVNTVSKNERVSDILIIKSHKKILLLVVNDLLEKWVSTRKGLVKEQSTSPSLKRNQSSLPSFFTQDSFDDTNQDTSEKIKQLCLTNHTSSHDTIVKKPWEARAGKRSLYHTNWKLMKKQPE